MTGATRCPAQAEPIAEPLRDLLIEALVAALVADFERHPADRGDAAKAGRR